MYFQKPTIILMGLVCSSVIQAQIFTPVSSTKSYALSMADVGDPVLSEPETNFAGISNAGSNSIFMHLQNKYLLYEYTNLSLGGIIVYPYGGFGINLNYSGLSVYSAKQYGLSYSKSFGKRLMAGIKFTALTTKILDQKPQNFISFEIASLFTISKEITGGIIIKNPIQYQDLTPLMPSTFQIGLSYNPYQCIYINIEEDLRAGVLPRPRIGLRCKQDKLWFASGIALHPIEMSVGAGFRLNSLQTDFGVSVHHLLGPSSQVTFSYGF